MYDDDTGLFYVRAWTGHNNGPVETKFTSMAVAEKFMDKTCRDRAYTRIEFLVAREWTTRSIVPPSLMTQWKASGCG